MLANVTQFNCAKKMIVTISLTKAVIINAPSVTIFRIPPIKMGFLFQKPLYNYVYTFHCLRIAFFPLKSSRIKAIHPLLKNIRAILVSPIEFQEPAPHRNPVTYIAL